MSADGHRSILVLHDIGDARGGEPWREALAAAGWSGPVDAPDLPGHAGSPAPVGGAYDLADPALVAVARGPEADGTPPPLVVGVGLSGWSAWLLALGGRAGALVLVDGLGGPWRDPRAVVAERRRRQRATADDADAVGPPPPSGLDPRLRHRVGPQGSRPLAVRAAAATPVPTMVVETPASASTADEAAELVACFPDGPGTGGATLVQLSDGKPSVVAPAVLAWAELAGHLEVPAGPSPRS